MRAFYIRPPTYGPVIGLNFQCSICGWSFSFLWSRRVSYRRMEYLRTGDGLCELMIGPASVLWRTRRALARWVAKRNKAIARNE